MEQLFVENNLMNFFVSLRLELTRENISLRLAHTNIVNGRWPYSIILWPLIVFILCVIDKI